jgi:hypothetical protein
MNQRQIILTSALGLTVLLGACSPNGTDGTGTTTTPIAPESPIANPTVSPTISPTVSPTIAPTASPTTSP